MIDFNTFPEVTRDPDGYRIHLKEFSVIGERYRELQRRDDSSWIQPGAAESWLDFCRLLKRVIDETSTWEDWDTKSVTLDESHCGKFTRLTLDTQELRKSLQSQDADRDSRNGLKEFLAEVFDTAKCSGAARGMICDEFELTLSDAEIDLSNPGYRLWLSDDVKTADTLRWLIDNQSRVINLLKPAMKKTFEWMRETDPKERILFPPGDAEQLAPDRYLLDTVSIRGNRITLGFETPCGHFEEHGCDAVIRDGVLERFGHDPALESSGSEDE